MSVKIKAIITVEVEDIEGLGQKVECKLEDGTKILLKKENLVLLKPTDFSTDLESGTGNFLVTC